MSPIALLKNFGAIFAFAFFAAISACGPVAAVESLPTASKSAAEAGCKSNPACLVDFYSEWVSMMPDTVRAMIEAGADVRAKSSYDLTPLHYAAGLIQNPEIIAVLIDAGADVNAKAKDGETPLHRAADTNKNLAVITALIESGANVNARGRANFTPLHRAARTDASPEVITALIKAGAFVEATTDDGKTPIFLALKAGRSPEVIAALTDAGADKNAAEKAIRVFSLLKQVEEKSQQRQREKALEKGYERQLCTTTGLLETWHCPASGNHYQDFVPCEKTNSNALVGYCRIITDFVTCKFCSKPENWKQDPNHPIKVNFYRGKTKEKEFWFCRFNTKSGGDFICN